MCRPHEAMVTAQCAPTLGQTRIVNMLSHAVHLTTGHAPLLQVPLCMFLAEKVPALGHFRVGADTTVLDALVDAAEALQVAELQARHPGRVNDMEQVGCPA